MYLGQLFPSYKITHTYRHRHQNIVCPLAKLLANNQSYLHCYFVAFGSGAYVQPCSVCFYILTVPTQRANIPASVTQSTSTSPMDISDWGQPSASYPSETCNITQFFSPQNLVFDITLCGIWYIPRRFSCFFFPTNKQGWSARNLPSSMQQCRADRNLRKFLATLSSVPSFHLVIQYNDNVVGPGGRYSNAYFEISYLRAYTTGGAVPTPTAALVTHSMTSSSATITTAPAGTALIPSPLFFPGNSNDASRGRCMAVWKLALWLGIGTMLGKMLG